MWWVKLGVVSVGVVIGCSGCRGCRGRGGCS